MDAYVPNERRKGVRQPVLRRTLFSGKDGVLQLGNVTDASPGGMRIETTAPAAVGAEIDIEVHPSSGEWAGGLRLRGRVVRSEARTCMGIRLLPFADRRKPDAPAAPPHYREPVRLPVEREPAVQPRPRSRLWPWAIPPAALALLLLLLLRLPEDALRRGIAGGSDARAQHSMPVAAVQPPPLEETTGPALADALSSVTGLASDHAALQGPSSPLPLEDFARVEGRLEALRKAAERAAGSKADPADKTLPWIYAQSADQGLQVGLVPEQDWQGLEVVPAVLTAEEAEITLAVDKSEHRLVLKRNGLPLRTFDVGLGRNDSTPEGDFRIAVKATNPAWKHRGRIIPGGSPENRIGKRWMALGQGEETTSYGIHPAKNTRTVGANASFGCIQMYPEDADTLFRFCPVGTRVCIRP